LLSKKAKEPWPSDRLFTNQISFHSEKSNPQETPAGDYLSFLPDARTIWAVWSRGRFSMA